LIASKGRENKMIKTKENQIEKNQKDEIREVLIIGKLGKTKRK
jgi:hypothetical protein